MSPEDRQDAARDILAIRLFHDLMGEMEQSAVNSAVNAKYNDHEARQAYLAEVRAIRSLRSKIETLAQVQAPKAVRKAPA